MLAVALHCDPEIIAQEGWRYGTSSRISTRPKSISGAKCCSLNIQVRLAAMSEGDTGYRGGGAAWLCTGYRGIGRLLGNGICPVIGGSSDARVFGALLRIASAACWKAAAAFSSSLVR